MINNYILNTLNNRNVKTATDFENVLREEVQKIILLALGKTSFFAHAAFYGGTCLRLFYGLDRFSEDLDFAVLSDKKDFSWNDYIGEIKTLLDSFGFETNVYSKPEYDLGEVKRRYIKIPVYNLVNEYFGKPLVNKERLVSVKIEVSSELIDGAKTEYKLLVSPIFSNVLCYDLPSLFSGKMNALLTRNWRNRVKGRDYYDYMFFLSQNVRLNMDFLKNKLAFSMGRDTSDFTIDNIKDLLKEKINEIDFNEVKKDIMPFILNDSFFNAINKEYFLSSIEHLKC